MPNLTISLLWEGGCHWKEKSRAIGRQVVFFKCITSPIFQLGEGLLPSSGVMNTNLALHIMYTLDRKINRQTDRQIDRYVKYIYIYICICVYIYICVYTHMHSPNRKLRHLKIFRFPAIPPGSLDPPGSARWWSRPRTSARRWAQKMGPPVTPIIFPDDFFKKKKERWANWASNSSRSLDLSQPFSLSLCVYTDTCFPTRNVINAGKTNTCWSSWKEIKTYSEIHQHKAGPFVIYCSN